MNFEKSNILKEKSWLEKNNQEEIFNIDNEKKEAREELKEGINFVFENKI